MISLVKRRRLCGDATDLGITECVDGHLMRDLPAAVSYQKVSPIDSVS